MASIKFISRMLLVVALGMLAPSTHADLNKTEVGKHLEKVIDEWRNAFNQGDFESVLDFYTDKPTVMVPGEDLITDKQALEKIMRDVHGEYDHYEKGHVITKAACGGIVLQGLTYILSSSDGSKEDLHGETVLVWTKEQNKWKIDWVIWAPHAIPAPKVNCPQ